MAAEVTFADGSTRIWDSGCQFGAPHNEDVEKPPSNEARRLRAAPKNRLAGPR